MIILLILALFVIQGDSAFRKGANGVCQAPNGKLRCCKNFVYIPATESCVLHCAHRCDGGKCTRSGQCICAPPLVLKDGNACVPPVCDSPCINGTCTGNNTCTCNNGYQLQGQFQCVPRCNQTCINGECIAPDTCSCDQGYTSIESKCEPICENCSNGTCEAPNSCKCFNGYEKTNNGGCAPKCSSCSHGTCLSPEKCVCKLGYHMINGTCAPICENCSHGVCTAPNVCKCEEGYTKVNNTCVPKCKSNCDNGFCSAPDVCRCNNGYKINPYDKLQCLPQCSNECINATCAEPNFCKCFNGYERTSNNTCAPKCSSCEHGTCMSPDFCICKSGYQMINGTCSPVCRNACINGICVEPNVCSCNEGYVYDSTLPSRCYKPCVACKNGECDVNGNCLCKTGLVLEKEDCVVPFDCKTCGGVCVRDAICSCNNGSACLFVSRMDSAEIISPSGLAGLQLTWLLGGCFGLIILSTLIAVMIFLWRRRSNCDSKQTDASGNVIGSVAYTVGGTLTRRNVENQKGINLYGNINEYDEANFDDEDKETAEELLPMKVNLNNERCQ